MNRRRLIALCLSLLLAVGTPASGQTVPEPSGSDPAGSEESLVVVVHAKNALPTVSAADLRNIWLGNTGYWPDNVPIRPYNRPSEDGAGYVFYKSILKMVPSRFGYYWQARQLSGRGNPPEVVESAADVIRLVAASQEAVGYLLQSELPADTTGVRVLRVDTSGD